MIDPFNLMIGTIVITVASSVTSIVLIEMYVRRKMNKRKRNPHFGRGKDDESV